MAERPVQLEGANLALLVGQVVLWVVLGLVAFGPGRSSLAAARSELASRIEREEAWAEAHDDAEALNEDERAAWAADVEALRSIGAPADDEHALTAWVAAALREPSVHGLEVVPELEGDGATSWTAQPPDGGDPLTLVERRVRVRFDARYSDLARILGRIEAAGSGLVLRSLQARRQSEQVRVEMELDLFARRRGSAS